MQDVAGWRERLWETTPANLAALKAELVGFHPALAEALKRPGVQVAVDKVIVRDNPGLSAGAEVAFLAPMSGG